MPRILKSSEGNFQQNLLNCISYEAEQNLEVQNTVAQIISNVRKSGDDALFDYTKKFDNFDITPETLKVTTDEIDDAYAKCDQKIIDAFRLAYTRVKDYHERQVPLDERYEDETGVKLGWRWTAVDSVGLYVPGGKAFYPSSVIMNAVPALVAGVRRIAMVSPAISGNINPMVLVAARICGIHEIYKVGGAQAVAALAHGTNSIAPVCKIVGPGNAYVAEAKRQVFGKVGIDMIAGPSEILVISDDKTNPKWVAADLLSGGA